MDVNKMILVVRTQVKSIAHLALKSILGCHGIRPCNLRDIVITVYTKLEPAIYFLLTYQGFMSHLLQQQRTDIAELNGYNLRCISG